MSNVWKAVSLVTLVVVVLTAAAVVVTRNPVAVAAPAQANDTNSQSGITVVAQGEAKAKPDVAYINVGVRVTAPTAKEAMDKNNAAMTAVIAKLEAMGIAKKDMQTGNISLYPQIKAPKADEPNAEEIVSYLANNTLNVTVNDLNRVGEILDAAIAAGANTVSGIRFGIKEDAKLRDAALTDAVKNARAKADLVASGLGLKVTGVQSASVESYGGVQPYYVEAAMALGKGGGGDSVPVEAGEVTYTASVRVTFGF